jgi:predicted nucleic-acid-binding Zn-ribbon protein
MKVAVCAKCGSSDIVANAFLQPDGHGGQVVVWNNERHHSALKARICVACGFAELFVTNPETFLSARRK